MAKFLKYFFEYKSLLSETHRVEIWEEGTTTPIIELQAGAEPFTTENNNDVAEKYLGGIVPTVATVMMSATDSFNSAYFSKQKYGDYVLKFFVNGVVKSNAIITPFEANDLDRNGGYPITLSAECGLRNLKNKKYIPTKTRVKLISVLKTCLAQIGFIDNFPIKVIDNTKCYGTVSFEQLLDPTPSKYWEAYCDDVDFEGLNCYEVIDRIRKPYNQVFFDHVNGCWFVRNVDEISSQNSTIRTYSWADLSFTDLSYNRPSKAFIDRQNGSFGRMFSHQSVVVKKGKSKLKIRNTWGSFDNLTGWTFSGAAGVFYVINNGRLYNSQASFSTQEAVGVDQSYIQSPQFLYTPFNILEEKEKLTIEADVEMGSVLTNLRMQIITGFNGAGGIANFLSTDGNWYTVENDQVPNYEQGQFFGTPIYEAKPSGGKLKIDIPTPPYHANNEWVNQLNNIGHIGYWNNPFMSTIPLFPENVEYYLVIRIFFPERGISESATNTSTDAAFGLYIDNLSIRASNQDPAITEGFERKFTLNDTQDRETDLTVDVGIGFPSYLGTDALYKTPDDISQIQTFSKNNAFFGSEIDKFISDSYLAVLGKRLQTYQGVIRESLGFGDLVSIMGIKYRLHNAKYNARMHYTEIKGVELATNATSSILETLVPATDDQKIVDEKIEKAVGRIEIPEFSSVNFEKKVLPSGKSVIMMNPNMRMKSAFADQFYAKSVAGGVITTEAELTNEDYLQIQPAASGTIALQEWVEENTWLIGGNTVTESKAFGTVSGDFDIPILRNNVTVGIINSKGLALPTIESNQGDSFQFIGIESENNDNQLIKISAEDVASALVYENQKHFWKLGGNTGVETPQTIGIDIDENINIDIFGSTIATFTPLGNFGVGIANPSAVIHGHANVSGNADVVLLRATNQSANYFFSVAVNPNLNEVRLYNSGTLRVKNTWQFDAQAHFAINATTVDATQNTHVPNWGQVQALTATGIKFGEAVRSVSTSNITLSGTQTINGYAALVGDRILVSGQTTASQNGVYIVSAGEWTRATDSDTDLELRNYVYPITGGTFSGWKYKNSNPSAITIGTTAISYTVYDNNIEADPIFNAWRNTTQNKNLVYASSGTVDGGIPSFRSLVVADIPVLNQNTTGSAGSLTTARNIAMTGDIAWNVNFNGSNNVTAVGTLATVNSNVGTYRSVTVNAKGLVTAASNPTTLVGYGITDAYTKTESDARYQGLDADLTAIGALSGTSGVLRKTAANTWSLDTNTFVHSGNLFDFRATTNQAGVVVVGFTMEINGFGVINQKSGIVAANTYKSVTVDTYGRVTAGTNPTTLAGYGITDVYSKTEADDRFVVTSVMYSNPTWLAGLEWFKINGVPTSFPPSPHTHLATHIVAGILDTARLGSGTASATTFLRGDQTWATISAITALTGDVTASGSGSVAATLSNTGVTAGTYRSVTVDAKGRVTGATNPTTVSSYGITDFYAQIVSGFAVGSNSTVLNTDSLEVALEKLQGQINARISGNQNITLSGIITGSGTTAITTAIADNVLSIAKTSGLQTALDARMLTSNYPDLVNIENLSGTTGLLRKTAVNTWSLDNTAYLTSVSLPNTRIAFGNGSNILASSANFAFEDDRIISIKNGVSSKMELARFINSNNYGVFVTGGNLDLQVLSGGIIFSKSNHNFEGRILLNNAAGNAGQVLTSQGAGANPIWTTVAAGGVQNIDAVLGAGNTAFNKNLILNGTNGVYDSAALRFQQSGTTRASILYDNQYVPRLVIDSSQRIQINANSQSVELYGSSTIIGSLAGTGTRMVVADANGVLSTQAIPSGGGGGSVGTIDQVLAAGNTAANKTLRIRNGAIDFLSQDGSVIGGLSGISEFNGVPSSLTLSAHPFISIQANTIALTGNIIGLGVANTISTISLNGTTFNFSEESQNMGMGQNGNQWGWAYNQGSPQLGDRIIFFFDGTKFVMSHVKTYVGAGGKTYLTID